jgi:glycosyltransferase involved in cell wall biosynthesis
VLRVAIDSRVTPDYAGGVQLFLLGLAHSLGTLSSPDERYVFLVNENEGEWLEPYLGTNSKTLVVGTSLDARLNRHPLLGRAAHLAAGVADRLLGSRAVSIPAKPAALDETGLDLVHFATQRGFSTSLPSIYQPWDLQHRHFPEFFTRRQYTVREVQYQAFCHAADRIVVASRWGRDDLVAAFGVDPAKVEVIPLAAPTAAYDEPTAVELEEVRRRLDLPDTFLIYPAHAWHHKNHLALVEAVAIARDELGVELYVVCPGQPYELFATIQRRIERHSLQRQIRFVGWADPLTMQCLYRLCAGMVFPSLFEGWGLPVTEAFQAGVPVACSNATCLPEAAGDAALLFDPEDPQAIAAAAVRLLDSTTRQELIERGRRRADELSWEKVAAAYRRLYTTVAAVTRD